MIFYRIIYFICILLTIKCRLITGESWVHLQDTHIYTYINAQVRRVWYQWYTVNNRHYVYPRLPATLGGQVGVGHGSQDYPVQGIFCLKDILFKWTPCSKYGVIEHWQWNVRSTLSTEKSYLLYSKLTN